MSFDTATQIHIKIQNVMFLHVPFQQTPVPAPHRDNRYSGFFFNHRLIMPVLGLQVDGFIQYSFFVRIILFYIMFSFIYFYIMFLMFIYIIVCIYSTV